MGELYDLKIFIMKKNYSKRKLKTSGDAILQN